MSVDMESDETQRKRVNKKQLAIMVNYMSENLAFARSQFEGVLGKVTMKRRWEELEKLLNDQGPPKPVELWKRTWKDLKCKARAKNARLNLEKNRTGNVEGSTLPLTPTEEKILNIIGRVSSEPLAQTNPQLQQVDIPCGSSTIDLPIEDVEVEVDPECVEVPLAVPGRITSTPNSRSVPKTVAERLEKAHAAIEESEERNSKIMEQIAENLGKVAGKITELTQAVQEGVDRQGRIEAILERIAESLEKKESNIVMLPME